MQKPFVPSDTPLPLNFFERKYQVSRCTLWRYRRAGLQEHYGRHRAPRLGTAAISLTATVNAAIGWHFSSRRVPRSQLGRVLPVSPSR